MTTEKTLALHSTTSGRKSAPEMVMYNPDLYVILLLLPNSLSPQWLLYMNTYNNVYHDIGDPQLLHHAAVYSNLSKLLLNSNFHACGKVITKLNEN